LFAEESLTPGIFVASVIVTAPIDLDHKSHLVAEEIDDVGTDWLLAAKL
jgi:hypothetical protein